jgi:hypothetical protein
MSWYSNHWVAYATFLPLSAALALRPWLGLREEALQRRPLQQGHYVACQVKECVWRGGAEGMRGLAVGGISCRWSSVGQEAPTLWALWHRAIRESRGMVR